MSVTVFHGSNEPVERPLCSVGRPNLDFGQGFYLTEMRPQAADLARDKVKRYGGAPVLNRYRLDKEAYIASGRCLRFEAYDRAWLEFIISNRLGENAAEGYDYIEGGVADDRVAGTIELFFSSIISLDDALRRLSQHRPNHQICLRNQQLIDQYLIYEGHEQL